MNRSPPLTPSHVSGWFGWCGRWLRWWGRCGHLPTTNQNLQKNMTWESFKRRFSKIGLWLVKKKKKNCWRVNGGFVRLKWRNGWLLSECFITKALERKRSTLHRPMHEHANTLSEITWHGTLGRNDHSQAFKTIWHLTSGSKEQITSLTLLMKTLQLLLGITYSVG